MGANVRAVRRHRVRRGQHGPDAAGRGQGRAGHDAAAPGRGRPAGAADAVRGQQGGRAGRVRCVRGRRRAPAARARRAGPPVAVGQHRRGGRAGPSRRGRAPGGHGLAGGPRESAGRPQPMSGSARRSFDETWQTAEGTTPEMYGIYTIFCDFCFCRLGHPIFTFLYSLSAQARN